MRFNYNTAPRYHAIKRRNEGEMREYIINGESSIEVEWARKR